jgi:hypothetical protein
MMNSNRLNAADGVSLEYDAEGRVTASVQIPAFRREV